MAWLPWPHLAKHDPTGCPTSLVLCSSCFPLPLLSSAAGFQRLDVYIWVAINVTNAGSASFLWILSGSRAIQPLDLVLRLFWTIPNLFDGYVNVLRKNFTWTLHLVLDAAASTYWNTISLVISGSHELEPVALYQISSSGEML